MNIRPINQYEIDNNKQYLKVNPAMQGFKPVFKTSQPTAKKSSILTKIKDYFINYPKRINYTWQHKKAFLQVEKDLCGKNSIQGYLHDTDKLFMYIIGVPKNLAHKIHVSTAPHHIRNGKVKSPMMAIIDWESARYTKPDKPLSAREYYEQKCPKIPVIEMLLKKYGL